MSNNTKSFGAGAIIVTILSAVFLTVAYWIGDQASQIPRMKIIFKSEISHINKNLKMLTQTTKETNNKLENNLARIAEALVTHKYKLRELEKDCEEAQEYMENYRRIK